MTGKILTALKRALGRLRGEGKNPALIDQLEDTIDLSTSAFPRLYPVAKYPIFRTPDLEADHVLELAIEFMRQVLLRDFDPGNPEIVAAKAATLREMAEDRETVTITPIGGLQMVGRGGKLRDLNVTRLEIRFATPLLLRLHEDQGRDWTAVARLLAENLESTIEQAVECATEFETSLDDVRAYTFSLDSSVWLRNQIFVSGLSIYTHWIKHMFYMVIGETPEDFDSWVRYGRIGAATRKLFS
jgi:hypothetical protein